MTSGHQCSKECNLTMLKDRTRSRLHTHEYIISLIMWHRQPPSNHHLDHISYCTLLDQMVGACHE